MRVHKHGGGTRQNLGTPPEGRRGPGVEWMGLGGSEDVSIER
jgi:hypothetical protein